MCPQLARQRSLLTSLALGLYGIVYINRQFPETMQCNKYPQSITQKHKSEILKTISILKWSPSSMCTTPDLFGFWKLTIAPGTQQTTLPSQSRVPALRLRRRPTSVCSLTRQLFFFIKSNYVSQRLPRIPTHQ
jgi:hypothetical protein